MPDQQPQYAATRPPGVRALLRRPATPPNPKKQKFLRPRQDHPIRRRHPDVPNQPSKCSLSFVSCGRRSASEHRTKKPQVAHARTLRKSGVSHIDMRRHPVMRFMHEWHQLGITGDEYIGAPPCTRRHNGCQLRDRSGTRGGICSTRETTLAAGAQNVSHLRNSSTMRRTWCTS